MTATHRVQVKAYVLPEEKEEIQALADQAKIKVSELIRRLCLGRSLPDTNRLEAIRELSRVNADQARLGNLFKMALDDQEFKATLENEELEDARDIIYLIRDAQLSLRQKIKEL